MTMRVMRKQFRIKFEKDVAKLLHSPQKRPRSPKYLPIDDARRN
jgi:hypothetical protein